MNVQQQDPDGVYRQAIPLPFYSTRLTWVPPFLADAFLCMDCKVKFRTEQAYRDHYRSDHPEPGERA